MHRQHTLRKKTCSIRLDRSVHTTANATFGASTVQEKDQVDQEITGEAESKRSVNDIHMGSRDGSIVVYTVSCA